ncbi:APC family permease [Mycolicibacterium baixiangningiae]|uniref:APC family permease n=1 Tax=Mycolicibacterium baixiangningiae TaxID=2761578 RepID=UPI0018D05F45|nr:APC family permease [Mycolicibacterium baixiangningiae]
MTSDNAPPEPVSDEQDLAQFGYSQRLKRSMSTFTSFCLAFSMIAITGTLGPLLGPALTNVGGVAVWFWLLAFVGVIWIVLVFMHMAARIPVTGYAYQWTSRITTPYFGWVVAVVGIITFTTGATSIGALFGSIVAPELGMSGTNAQIMWLGVAALTFCFAINIVGIRYATRFNNGVAVAEIVYTVVIALVLLIGALFFFRHSGFGLIVDSHGVNGDNSVHIPWQNYLFAATAPIFSLMGWEASADLAEETKDPRRAAPKAMFRAVAICSAAGFVVMAIFVAAIPTSVEEAVQQPNMMFWIVQEHLGSFPAALLKIIAFASLLGCIVANVAVATRLVYSVARDGLLPFSKQFSKVSPRWQTPVNASIALWVVCMVVDIAGAGNIFRITSMAVIAYYLSYVLTMVAVLVGHKTGRIPEPKGTGYFGLGKTLVPVTCLGLLWAVTVIVSYLSPAANRYIIGYFGIALGIGAFLTIYAWSAIKSGRAKLPEAEAVEAQPTDA